MGNLVNLFLAVALVVIVVFFAGIRIIRPIHRNARVDAQIYFKVRKGEGSVKNSHFPIHTACLKNGGTSVCRTQADFQWPVKRVPGERVGHPRVLGRRPPVWCRPAFKYNHVGQ